MRAKGSGGGGEEGTEGGGLERCFMMLFTNHWTKSHYDVNNPIPTFCGL